MHTATLLSLQDELEKIAGVMEDAGAEYAALMKKHMHNPQVVARMHPTERVNVFKHLNSPKNAGLGGKIVAKAGKAVASFGKAASVGRHAVELAGLATLAAPSVSGMRGKEWSEKNKHRAEVVGLSTLAAPYVYDLGKEGLGKLKGLAKKAPRLASKLASTEKSPYSKGEKAAILAGGAVHGANAASLARHLIKGTSPGKGNLAASVGASLIPLAIEAKRKLKGQESVMFNKKNWSKKKTASDLWEPETGRVIGNMGSRAANSGVATAATAAKKPQFTLAHLKGAYQKAGLKPGITSAVRGLAKAV